MSSFWVKFLSDKIINISPQIKKVCSRSRLLPTATKLWPRLCFYSCLWFCPRGGGLPQRMLGYSYPPQEGGTPRPRRPPKKEAPPTMETPLPRRPPPAKETPQEGDPLPGPQRGKLRGIRSRPTPKGEIEGDQIQAHTQGGNWGGSDPGPHPRGKLRGIRSRPTPKGEIEGDQIQPPHHMVNEWRVCILLECILVVSSVTTNTRFNEQNSFMKKHRLQYKYWFH